MTDITFQEEKVINRESLLNLYNDVGWIEYTNNPDRLENAIKNSLYVLTARDRNKLVELIRIVGDGLTIAYIQDILLLKEYKRKKIGTLLITKALDKFKHVRQKVLLTDDTEEAKRFYKTFGFESCENGNLVSFVKFESKREE